MKRICVFFSLIGVTVGEGASGVCFAGDQAILTVTGPDPASIGVGAVICDPSQPIKATTKIEARIVIFNIDIPIIKGCQVICLLLLTF